MSGTDYAYTIRIDLKQVGEIADKLGNCTTDKEMADVFGEITIKLGNLISIYSRERQALDPEYNKPVNYPQLGVHRDHF